MRLFEAIIDANHRAVAGDATAGLRPADFADELPVIALTCIDPRLNAFFPNALALPAEQFIWLRNAGNIIFDPMSSMTRTLALACAVKGGREIAIIGHTDCQICKTTAMQLLDEFKELGVDRSRLPENLNEFFGISASERQNVIKACDIVRQSPLIGPKIPVHGLLVDIESGKLDWIVNGYETHRAQTRPGVIDFAGSSGAPIGAHGSMADFNMGEMKFPEMKIGDATARTELSEIKPVVASAPPPQIQPLSAATARPPKIPLPPPIRPRLNMADKQGSTT
jgi:carbonic anhydrase